MRSSRCRQALPKAGGRLRRDVRGAVLIEAAFALPLMILMLLGTITYAGWFMAAHSIQQAANDAARAALGGMDQAERQELAEGSIEDSVVYSGTVEPDLVTISSKQEGVFFRVTVRYDVGRSDLYRISLVPLPGNSIERVAEVRLAGT